MKTGTKTNRRKLLHLHGQYYCDGTPAGVPCREENFKPRHLDFVLPVDQSALVLVDVWNLHHIESWLERVNQIVHDVIVPLMQAAREVGMTVIHAPSPECIKNSESLKLRALPGDGARASAKTRPSWPPPEFRERKGEFEIFKSPRYHPPSVGTFWDVRHADLNVHPAIQVREEDFVVETGEQLHRLCEQKRILHLLYAGFSTNGCLLRRDYGLVPMWERGYNTIIIRDATEGVEWADTLQQRWATELAIRECEQRNGFSILSREFIQACQRS